LPEGEKKREGKQCTKEKKKINILFEPEGKEKRERKNGGEKKGGGGKKGFKFSHHHFKLLARK